MRFVYHAQAGAPSLSIEGEAYRHLFKARRIRKENALHLRNLKDDFLYTYRIETLDRRRAVLALEEETPLRIAPEKTLHLGWCLIDPKSIEKALPSLNEIGVAQITFFHCARSQRSFRPDFERWERIVLRSCEQCGRSVRMRLRQVPELADFLAEEPQAHLLDFSSRRLGCAEGPEALVVGPEGGFEAQERARFPMERILGLGTASILRSETAVCAAAARILL
ncbi:16S rRNA (uracil(1498)-N(3))-methyltransferase [Nitratifractor sp.]